MKVLHVNSAETGSTGKIIADISRNLHARGDEAVLCAPKITSPNCEYLKKYAVSLPLEQGLYRRISYLTGISYGFAPLSTAKVIRAIKKECPDIVHLHSVNGCVVNVHKLLAFLKKHRIPTVVTNHAEFLYTGNCSYSHNCEKWKNGCGKCPSLKTATGSLFFDRTHTAWTRMKNAFDGFEKLSVVNVSPWLTERAKQSPLVNAYENYTILNGINTDVFHYKPSTPSDEKIIFHVTSAFSDTPGHIKGGEYIFELARRFAKENVKFVAAGPYNVKGEIPANVTLLGKLSNQHELADWYRKANLTVLTSKRETFGMAVAESLACGTPVAGFCSGGSESITIDDFSEFVPFGDTDTLEKQIREKWLDFKTQENAAEISTAAINKYADARMAREYFEIYQKLLK
ncbi:MAG: glycosyltransferase [Clostridia bacterium]|nr:glycosyltransferase [Clostridia bacterium]